MNGETAHLIIWALTWLLLCRFLVAGMRGLSMC